MREELDKKLCKNYPKIFKDRHGDARETLMCFGFEIGDGWYNIIDSLCKHIQFHIDWSYKKKQFDIDWNSENPEEQREIKEPVEQVVAIQIKEKFGGLRFYYDGGDDHISGLVRMAESWADHTCEVCGETGQSRKGGWIKTLCDKHEEDRQNYTTII